MVSRDVLTIGLTGGLASGKSTVLTMFADLGVNVIDTDEIAREVVKPDSAALNQIAEHFGQEFLHGDGSLNRSKLADLVFSNQEERQWLEALLHPVIWQQARLRSRMTDASYSMIAVPLLLETGAVAQVARVLVVDCDPALQLARALARDNSSVQRVEGILAAQLPRATKLQLADDVLDNNGTIDNLRSQVLTLHQRYLELG